MISSIIDMDPERADLQANNDARRALRDRAIPLLKALPRGDMVSNVELAQALGVSAGALATMVRHYPRYFDNDRSDGESTMRVSLHPHLRDHP